MTNFIGILCVVIYTIGVFVAYRMIEKQSKIFYKQHPNEYNNMTRQEHSQEDSLNIVCSLFSWLFVIVSGLGSFVHYGNGIDGEYE